MNNGGSFYLGYTVNVHLNNIIFNNNSAKIKGGAIFLEETANI